MSDLDRFVIGVDSTEDIYVVCQGCRRDVPLGRFYTLGELVAAVGEHDCVVNTEHGSDPT